jgi:DHA1 family multidrug resistance protein-like MFS transporter
MFGGAILLTLMAFARSAEELTLLRAIQGAVTGIITAANALIAASVPRERTGWALGVMQTSAWAGVAVGPLIGGVLADSVGYGNTFFLTGALTLIAGIAVHLWVVEDKEAITRGAEQRGSLMQEWRRSLATDGMGALYSVKFMVRLAATVTLPVAPLFVASLMAEGGNLATVAGLFTAATAAASTLSALKFGALGDRIGYRKVMIAGCVMSGAAYVLFLWTTSIWMLIALALLVGIANGAVIPNIGALLANASPEGGQGTTFGIDASVNAGARMFAPLIGTAVASWFTLQASFAVAGLFFLLAGVMAVLLVPRSEAAAALAQPSPVAGD